MDSALMVLTGQEITWWQRTRLLVALGNQEWHGVAAEGVPRIVRGFLAKKPDPYTPTETYPLRFSGHAISTWTRTDVI
jgi:hypothetical protein